MNPGCLCPSCAGEQSATLQESQSAAELRAAFHEIQVKAMREGLIIGGILGFALGAVAVVVAVAS